MAKAIGANPFTAADIKAMANIVDVGVEMLGYLDRCERCKLPVAHLVGQVGDIVERMKALVAEFGNDTTA